MELPIWTGDFAVDSLLLNPQKRLGLYGLLNLLSEVAWRHAEALGCGYDALQKSGIFWVLTRQTVTMSAWPVWGETLTIRSWARPFEAARAPRDFEIFIGDRKVGAAATLWLVLDSATRRPARLGTLVDTVPCRRDGVLEFDAAKISARDGLHEALRFCVRYGDLDLNGHVGNTRYGQWVLDAMPISELTKGRIVRYDVNFLAEVRLGEEVVVYRSIGEVAEGGEVSYHLQGMRGDGKVAFTARLGLIPG